MMPSPRSGNLLFSHASAILLSGFLMVAVGGVRPADAAMELPAPADLQKAGIVVKTELGPLGQKIVEAAAIVVPATKGMEDDFRGK